MRFKVLSIIIGLLSACSYTLSVQIETWSSTGGHTKNKDGPQDRMYLVKGGDKITFAVKAEGAEKYIWQVNKKVQKGAEGNTFTFTVPNEKGIWEIHVIAVSGKDKAHAEWVVSTLNKAEAPDIFDYFSDGKYYNRKDTDPWGRKLPEWGETDDHDYIQKTPKGIYDAKDGFLQKKPNAKGYLFLPSTAVYGTWRIKYKGSLGYYFVGTKNPGRDNRIQSRPGIYCYAHAGTGFYVGHFWFRGRTPPELFKGRFQKNIKYGSYGYPRRQSLAWRRTIAEYGTDLYHVPGWVDVKIIHTPDGAFYVWVNGRIVPGTFNIDNLAKVSQFIRFGNKTVDNVEVYKNRYLFPAKSAVYKEYVSKKSIDRNNVRQEIRKGIVINGRGVRLADIARMINDKSLFSYDKRTRTAICHTDLVLNGASELVLQNETLKMDSQSDGQRHIRIFEAATLRMENSTITSTNEHYYQWRFTSPYNTEFIPHGFSGGYFDARSILIARNSTIDNCGFLYLQAVRGLVLENTKFTNLVSINSGPCITYNPRFNPVVAAFWYRETMPTYPLRSFRGLLFTSRKDKAPVSIVFDGGDLFGKLNIYNSVFSNVIVEARSHNKAFGGSIKYDWLTPDGKPCWGIAETKRTLNLINCKFDRLLPANEFCYIQPKYYLDLKVVDTNGKPVPDAKVTIVNEIDDEDHPAENIKEGLEWTCTYGEGYGGHLVPFPKWGDVNDMRTTTTGPDGHTPLPSVKDKTIVLTDYTLMSKKNFDGVRIAWQTSTNRLVIEMDVYDDLKGHLMHQRFTCPSNQWQVGQTHHAKFTYNKDDSSVRLIVTNKSTGKVVWDTGTLPIYTYDRSKIVRVNLDLNHVEIGIGRSRVPRGKTSFVKWDKAGFISMYHSGVSSGGRMGTHVDNLTVDVKGLGLIEKNDFSTMPNYKAIPAKVYGYNQIMPQAMISYPMKGNTAGRSFTLEFDNTLDKVVYRYHAASVVWLRSPTKQARREYTYRIIVEKDGKKKTITGVNPSPMWYRPDPNKPTYTITAVLDGKTVTESALKKQCLAGPAILKERRQ